MMLLYCIYTTSDCNSFPMIGSNLSENISGPHLLADIGPGQYDEQSYEQNANQNAMTC